MNRFQPAPFLLAAFAAVLAGCGVSSSGATGSASDSLGCVSGSQQRLYTRMDETADEYGFVVAYPNGLSNSWNAGVCCGPSSNDDVDDVGFTRAIIDDQRTRLDG